MIFTPIIITALNTSGNRTCANACVMLMKRNGAVTQGGAATFMRDQAAQIPLII